MTRLDIFLRDCGICPDLSRSEIKKLIAGGFISVNGDVCRDSDRKVAKTDLVTLDEGCDFETMFDDAEIAEIEPIDIPLDVIFENENLVVINKPPQLSSHPGAGKPEPTLVNALMYKYGKELSDCVGMQRLGIVHRLDKDTTGLMLVAKNNFAHKSLSEQIANKSCVRKYIALCHGTIVPYFGTISTNIVKDSDNYRKFVVPKDERGKVAVTNYKTLEIFAKGVFSLVELQLETGRTHQIRVHLLHKKHPIVGDQTYRNEKYIASVNQLESSIKEKINKFLRQALHSYFIEFNEPTTEERLSFSINPYPDIKELLDALRDV